MRVHVPEEWGVQRPKAREPLQAGAGVGSVDLVDHTRLAKTHTEDPPQAAGQPSSLSLASSQHRAS